MQKYNNKIIIGRKDKIDFPDLKLYNINAKVDSGAFGSAIHCHNINIIERDSKAGITFNLLDPTHAEYNEKEFFVTEFKEKRIKSSFGKTQKRYAIKLNIVVFGEIINTEFSLTNRTNMRYPVLLGRKLLKDRFIVDVTQTDLSYKEKKERV